VKKQLSRAVGTGRNISCRKKYLVNEIITQLCRAGYLKDVQDREFEYDGSAVTFEAGARLNEFMRKVEPKKTIETGMVYGISAMALGAMPPLIPSKKKCLTPVGFETLNEPI